MSKDYSSRERRAVALLSQQYPLNLNGILIILLGVAVSHIHNFLLKPEVRRRYSLALTSKIIVLTVL